MPPVHPPQFNRSDGVALKEHLETRLAAMQEYFEARLAATDKATEAARGTMEKRLDGMNEFREALKDQSSRMATRDELNLRTDRLNAEIRDLQKFRDNLEGKASQQSVMIALLLSVVGLALTIAKWLTGG